MDKENQEAEYEELPTKVESEMRENQCYRELQAPPKEEEDAVVAVRKEVAQKVGSRDGHQGKVMIALMATILVVNVALVAVCVVIAVENSSVNLAARLESINTSLLNASANRDGTYQQEFNAQLETLNSSITYKLAQEFNAQLETLNSSFKFYVSDLASRIQQQFINTSCDTTQTPACAALPPSSPSGYYWVRAFNGPAVHVYCDMTRSCGNIIGGWMRVAYLDMRNASHQCPGGLMERTVPAQQTEPRTCVSTNPSPSCSNCIYFETFTISYSRVCGKVTGYQKGTTNGFANRQISIDSYYVDGISFTHGSPREHIWTLAAALDQQNNPCPGLGPPPNYVGENYFCDTGALSSNVQGSEFFANSPLWDCEGGVDCDTSSPPWFYRQLPWPTTDNIEMRVCRDEAQRHENVAIETIELYIQ